MISESIKAVIGYDVHFAIDWRTAWRTAIVSSTPVMGFVAETPRYLEDGIKAYYLKGHAEERVWEIRFDGWSPFMDSSAGNTMDCGRPCSSGGVLPTERAIRYGSAIFRAHHKILKVDLNLRDGFRSGGSLPSGALTKGKVYDDLACPRCGGQAMKTWFEVRMDDGSEVPVNLTNGVYDVCCTDEYDIGCGWSFSDLPGADAKVLYEAALKHYEDFCERVQRFFGALNVLHDDETT